MLGYTIYSEYTWFEQTAASLDDGIEVVESFPSSWMYQPWTYVVPVTKRFSAVDVAGARRNPELPGLVIADVYLFTRWSPVFSLPVLLDCPNTRRADIADARFDDTGLPVTDTWTELQPDDPLLSRLCG
jgi:hypothetical protein